MTILDKRKNSVVVEKLIKLLQAIYVISYHPIVRFAYTKSKILIFQELQ